MFVKGTFGLLKQAIFTAILVAVGGFSMAAEENKIYIVSDHWPGFSEPDGSGLYLDVMNKVFQPEGIQVSHKILPILRSIASINKGENVDVMLADWDKSHMTQDDNYQLDKIIVPSSPIFAEFVEAAFHPESTLAWSDIQADNSKKVAWIRGYGYQESFGLSEHPIVELNDVDQGLKMLIRGHIDCYLNDRAEFDFFVKAAGLKKIEWRRELVAMHKMYPIFHNNDRGRRFMAIFDRRMDELIQSGELFSLYQQYGFDYQQVLLDEIDPKQ